LGVEYISYHIILNDCTLRDGYVNKEICPKCGHDKYYKSKTKGKAHGSPHKLLRHIPIIPRIQSLFHYKQLFILQGQHTTHRSHLGVKYITTSIVMKHIEDTWLNKFKYEVFILQFSIDMDGFNLYSLQNTTYYIWLVVVINNDIPPWFSMKNEHIMMVFIILSKDK